MSKINKAIAALSVVASLGVAAAPMATFAAVETPNAPRDILNVTLEEVCAFGYTTGGAAISAGSHTNGTDTGYTTPNNTTPRGADPGPAAGAGYGLWSTLTVTGYDGRTATTATTDDEPDTDTAYGIMETNTVNQNFAKTQLNSVCNDKDGYNLTAQTTDLTTTGVTDGIVSNAAAPAAGTSSWAFQIAEGTREQSDSATNTGVVHTSAGDNGWYGGYTNATTIVAAPTTGTDKSTPNTGDRWLITYGVGISASQAAATYEGHVDYIVTSIDSQNIVAFLQEKFPNSWGIFLSTQDYCLICIYKTIII